MKSSSVALAATVLMVAALTAGAAPAGAGEKASPAAAAAVFTCNVTLPLWPTPSGGPTTCSGNAFGAGVHGSAPATALGGGNFTANVDTYSEGCFLGEPPLLGFASGTAHVGTSSGTVTVDFDWTRVGLTAVVVTSGPTVGGHSHSGAGAAVAAFVPTTVPLPTCADPGPLSATVAE